MADSKAGTFNAYLEYAQRGSTAAPSRPSTPATLLSIIRTFPQEAAEMSRLADLSGMSALGFQQAVKKLVESGFIEVSGQPLSETVKLTDKGRDAAALL